MSEYNIEHIDNNNSEPEKQPNYVMAIFAGLGAGVVVAVILAVLGIWLESEYIIALAIGAAIVGAVIHNFVPEDSVGGAIIGAILCPATYFMYQFIMAMYGYYYEDGETTFWVLLVGSAVYGAYMGYNKNDN